MKKLLPLLLLVVVLFPSCKESPEFETMFSDALIERWAYTLEPLSVPIVFYGDSRVQQANWEDAYPHKSLMNMGIGGDIVEGCIQRLPLLKALDAQYCFLAIGGNNALSEKYNGDSFEKKYDELLDKLQNMGITVYAQTIVGITTTNSKLKQSLVNSRNANIGQANEIIRRLAQDHGIMLIDVATLMNNPDGTMNGAYSNDGVHFNQEGLDKWYEILRPFVNQI